MTYLNGKNVKCGLIIMGYLPRKNDGLIVMGDLPRKMMKGGLIVTGDLPKDRM